jgi:hypothetical protein
MSKDVRLSRRRRNSQYKGPGVRMGLARLRNSTEVNMADGVNERVERW